jgi:hypothetical protein
VLALPLPRSAGADARAKQTWTRWGRLINFAGESAMPDQLNAGTRQEWQELGFFYDLDDISKDWIVVGSRLGLARFSALLRRYIADPRNAMLSEHEHYGPYLYLEVMTWTEAGMDDHAIHGTLQDLERLAELVDERAAVLRPGEQTRIREEYAPNAEYGLILKLREDGFDPATLDGNLSEAAAEHSDGR